MRKRWYRRILIMVLIVVSAFGIELCVEQMQDEFAKQQVNAGEISNELLIPGGMPIGIYMETDGVLVLGTDFIQGIDGQEYSPAKYLVKSGDYITEINGKKIETKKQLIAYVDELDSEQVILKIRRNNEEIEVKVEPVMTDTNEYKLGIWVRDSVQGLGTLTFLTLDHQFGALGHGIHDSDTESLLDISKGQVYQTKVVNIEKGIKGLPGGMEGIIIYNQNNLLGTIDQNTENGVYGTIDKIEELVKDQTAIPVASKKEVNTGSATIRCCITGEVKEYKIEIEKINWFTREENKGMVIKIVDEELLEMTGGIIQGMSGSPIIQNGKLVGAVTHVLVNDPTKGYGIFIENMLDAAS